MERLVGVVVGVSKALGQVVAVEDEALAALIHNDTVKAVSSTGSSSSGGEVVHPDAAGGAVLESPDVGASRRMSSPPERVAFTA